MRVRVQFYSYFKDLTGTSQLDEEMPPGSTIAQLLDRLSERFPKLRAMGRSTLVAVGVEYQPAAYQLQPGDEVSLFPPVQGG